MTLVSLVSLATAGAAAAGWSLKRDWARLQVWPPLDSPKTARSGFPSLDLIEFAAVAATPIGEAYESDDPDAAIAAIRRGHREKLAAMNWRVVEPGRPASVGRTQRAVENAVEITFGDRDTPGDVGTAAYWNVISSSGLPRAAPWTVVASFPEGLAPSPSDLRIEMQLAFYPSGEQVRLVFAATVALVLLLCALLISLVSRRSAAKGPRRRRSGRPKSFGAAT